VKQAARWHSERIRQPIRLVRWGHYGTPLLMFPTAGGDAGEIERFQLIATLQPLLDAGRVKIYSCDSIAGRAWLTGEQAEYCSWLQNQYDAMIYHEVVPAIRSDCHSADIEIISAGASIGAFNALASLCRHPDVFKLAICMSGTYNLERFLKGPFSDDLYFSSPLHYLPDLAEDSAQLQRLRQRFALLAFTQGRWEDPDESWRMAGVLGGKGIPNRVDPWGSEWDHDWPSWRAMLPHYLEEFL
jgi:esterase/lipase superfamily enzyme